MDTKVEEKSLELHWALVGLGIIRSASQESTKIFSPICSPLRRGGRHDESTSTLWHHGDRSTSVSARLFLGGFKWLWVKPRNNPIVFTGYATQKNQGIHQKTNKDTRICGRLKTTALYLWYLEYTKDSAHHVI